MGASKHIRADGGLRGASTLITATIPEFQRLSGISRSRIYELLAIEDLKSIRIGRRRLIVIDSYHELIKRKRAEGEK
jgi:predicted DNA-binding transcriptional regulator AlpA